MPTGALPVEVLVDWSTKVLPNWFKFEEIMYKLSIISWNIQFLEEISSSSSYFTWYAT